MNSNTKKIKRPFRNLICHITLWSFLFNALGANILVTPAMAISPGLSVPNFSVRDMQIPLSLGEIKDRVQGTADNTVIHIQDAHCNYSAQHSIASIIDHLSDSYNIRLVMLEGGKGNYDLSVFTKIKDPDIRKRVSDYFVKEGRVSGAEFFAINNPAKTKLFGIENENLYMSNLNAYKESLKYKEIADEHLSTLTHIINNLKREIYSPSLTELDGTIKAYKEKDLDLKEYMKTLIDKAEVSGIEHASFKNITSLTEIIEQEEAINFKTANAERSILIGKLESKLSRLEMERLVKVTIDFKKENITNEDFYGYLFKKARFANVDFKNLPNIVKYSEYVKKYESIDKIKLFQEIKTLEDALMKNLLETDDQKTLFTLDKNLQVMKNMFNVALIKEDYDYYNANKSDFNIKNFLNFFQSHSREACPRKLEAGSGNLYSLTKLDSLRKNMEKFYAYSIKRDNAFIKNMESKLKKENKNVTILVTGGFHTDNLKSIFKDKGYSYIEVMPRMDTVDTENPYFHLLSGGKSEIETLVETTILNSNITPLHMLSEMGITGTKSGKNLLELSVDVRTALETNAKKGIILMVPGGYLRLTHEKPDSEFFEKIGKIDDKSVYAVREENETYDPNFENAVIVNFDRNKLTYEGHQAVSDLILKMAHASNQSYAGLEAHSLRDFLEVGTKFCNNMIGQIGGENVWKLMDICDAKFGASTRFINVITGKDRSVVPWRIGSYNDNYGVNVTYTGNDQEFIKNLFHELNRAANPGLEHADNNAIVEKTNIEIMLAKIEARLPRGDFGMAEMPKDDKMERYREHEEKIDAYIRDALEPAIEISVGINDKGEYSYPFKGMKCYLVNIDLAPRYNQIAGKQRIDMIFARLQLDVKAMAINETTEEKYNFDCTLRHRGKFVGGVLVKGEDFTKIKAMGKNVKILLPSSVMPVDVDGAKIRDYAQGSSKRVDVSESSAIPERNIASRGDFNTAEMPEDEEAIDALIKDAFEPVFEVKVEIDTNKGPQAIENRECRLVNVDQVIADALTLKEVKEELQSNQLLNIKAKAINGVTREEYKFDCALRGDRLLVILVKAEDFNKIKAMDKGGKIILPSSVMPVDVDDVAARDYTQGDPNRIDVSTTYMPNMFLENRDQDNKLPGSLDAKTPSELAGRIQRTEIDAQNFPRDTFVIIECGLNGVREQVLAVHELRSRLPMDTDISNISGEAIIRFLVERRILTPHESSAIPERSIASNDDFNMAEMPEEPKSSDSISDDAAMAIAYRTLSEGQLSEFNRYGGSAGMDGLNGIIKNSNDDVAKAIAYSALVNTEFSEFNIYGGIVAVEALEKIGETSDSDTAKVKAHKRLRKYYSTGTNLGAFMKAINGLETIAINSRDEVAQIMACYDLIEFYSHGRSHDASGELGKIKASLQKNAKNDTVKAIIAASEELQTPLHNIVYNSTTASLFAKAIAADYLSREGHGPHTKGAALIQLEKIIENKTAKNDANRGDFGMADMPEDIFEMNEKFFTANGVLFKVILESRSDSQGVTEYLFSLDYNAPGNTAVKASSGLIINRYSLGTNADVANNFVNRLTDNSIWSLNIAANEGRVNASLSEFLKVAKQEKEQGVIRSRYGEELIGFETLIDQELEGVAYSRHEAFITALKVLSYLIGDEGSFRQVADALKSLVDEDLKGREYPEVLWKSTIPILAPVIRNVDEIIVITQRAIEEDKWRMGAGNVRVDIERERKGLLAAKPSTEQSEVELWRSVAEASPKLAGIKGFTGQVADIEIDKRYIGSGDIFGFYIVTGFLEKVIVGPGVDGDTIYVTLEMRKQEPISFTVSRYNGQWCMVGNDHPIALSIVSKATSYRNLTPDDGFRNKLIQFINQLTQDQRRRLRRSVKVALDYLNIADQQTNLSNINLEYFVIQEKLFISQKPAMSFETLVYSYLSDSGVVDPESALLFSYDGTASSLQSDDIDAELFMKGIGTFLNDTKNALALTANANRGDFGMADMPEVPIITGDVDSGIHLDGKLQPLSLDSEEKEKETKKMLFNLLNQAFGASTQDLFDGKPAMISLPINSEVSGVSIEEFSQYMGTVQGVRVEVGKKSVEFNVGNITYYIFEDNKIGRGKLLSKLEEKQAKWGVTDKEMAMRSIVYSFAKEIPGITNKAFTVYLEGEVKNGEFRTPTPLARCIAAGIKVFNLFDLTRPDRQGINEMDIKLAREDAVRGIISISGLSLSQMKDLADDLISKVKRVGLFALSGKLFIKIRPVNWNDMIRLHKMEREVLRAV